MKIAFPRNGVIIGIDPGITTGVAVLDLRSLQLVEKAQTRDPTEVCTLLDNYTYGKQVVRAVVIEDFVGSGPRDPNAITTIKYVGGFEMIARSKGYDVQVRAPQQRRPFVSQAKADYGLDTGEKHIADALAHVLSYIDFDAKEKEAVKRRAEQAAKKARHANGTGRAKG